MEISVRFRPQAVIGRSICYKPSGREFESLRARQIKKGPSGDPFLLYFLQPPLVTRYSSSVNSIIRVKLTDRLRNVVSDGTLMQIQIRRDLCVC